MSAEKADIVIGLDIGTTSTIGIAMRVPNDVIAVKRLDTTFSSPQPGWAEENPKEWWSNSCEILKSITDGIAPSRIAGICVTGMLPAVVLLDSEGHLLRPSIQQSDGRCSEQVEELKQEQDEAVFLSRTGNGINQQLVAAKLRWIARHEPDIFNQVATVFGSYDYINYCLTGVLAVEQNWALEAGFTDLSSHQIADDLVALALIPRTAVPPRSVSHEIMGTITAAAANLTGLPEGLPVFGGAADHIVSALAAGITQPGDTLLKFGGAGDIVVATNQACPDSRLYLDYHLVPGLYAPNGCMSSSGSALNWMGELLLGDENDENDEKPHKTLDKMIESIPAGSDGVVCIPYFLGEKTPIHDPLARGTFTGLSLGQTKGHLWRALLESITFGFRHHIEVLCDIGMQPTRYLASDGGTASRVWMQIMADVLNEPVQLLDNHYGSSVGAAFVAAIGSELIDDWSQAEQLSKYGDLIMPNNDNKLIYDQGYRKYRKLYECLQPYFLETA
jgi:xylulokinase